jgi:hypothetical protein
VAGVTAGPKTRTCILLSSGLVLRELSFFVVMDSFLLTAYSTIQHWVLHRLHPLNYSTNSVMERKGVLVALLGTSFILFVYLLSAVYFVGHKSHSRSVLNKIIDHSNYIHSFL